MGNIPDHFYSVGEVISSGQSVMDMPISGIPAIIRIKQEYLPAMYRMSEHSHFWILCWFHEADRSLLQTQPKKINTKLPMYGVFGLRTPSRPNPIALSLVRLERIDGEELHVSGLDAFDGTTVLDIKPYFEADIVFSPRTPYIRPQDYEMRKDFFRKQALAHHGEECLGLELGVKMALLVDEHFGQIQSPDLKLTVCGDACLADVLQGLTRARLSNPSRFAYDGNAHQTEVSWEQSGKRMHVTVRQGVDINIARQQPESELFELKMG